MSTNFSLKEGLLISLSVLTVFVAYYLFYTFRVLPNTHFGSISISNEKFEELDVLVQSHLEAFEKEKIDLTVEGKTIQTNFASLGVSFDKNSTVEKILANNKGFNRKITALFAPTKVTPQYQLDSNKFALQIEGLFKDFESKPKDATITFKDGKFLTVNEQEGSVIDRSELAQAIRKKIENLSSTPIRLSKISATPQVKAAQAQRAVDKVNKLAGKRIVLTFRQDSWEISPKKLIDLIMFYAQGEEEGYVLKIDLFALPIILDRLSLADSGESLLEIAIDKRNLSDFIADVAVDVDSPTVDATAKFEGGRIVEFTAARDGQKLDREKTMQLILEKISIEEEVQGEIAIKLPVSVTTAKIASQEINSLGIRELIGRGISYFAGSIPNRIHNIALGSERVNGVIVKPGETFSFNQNVGEVSAKTGYKQAYVISAGRTILDDGGGICQVSTTIFRSALNAGLPITARTAHAYRVGYYEQRGFQAGLDATVWAPAVDLQFKNDTENYILVQAIVDKSRAKLQVDIYGAADGRRVIMTEPSLSNQKPAPPDKYQDDPSLPKGTIKQADFAAPGGTSVFARKVYKGDELIIDESYRSNYRPWQAVYLVGTGG